MDVNFSAYPTDAKWWDALDSVIEAERDTEQHIERENYLFGRCLLSMECEDKSFSYRFKEIFSECACDSIALEGIASLLLRVRFARGNPEVLVVTVDPCLIDGVDFARQLYPDRNYLEYLAGPAGWRMLAPSNAPSEPVFAFGSSTILISRRHPWQHMLAMYGISNAFRLQPNTLVIHAASVAIDGKGVLLFGDKGAGKTTLSLCLASRGHTFLGDEWGAVSESNGELLPMRSLSSIRQGPKAKRVDEYLQKHSCRTTTLADGSTRVRAGVGVMFPEALARVVPLTHAFFLRRFASRPKVAQFAREGAELLRVSPLLATVCGQPSGRLAIELLRRLGKAHLWNLDVGGSPEETADLIEKTVKED